MIKQTKILTLLLASFLLIGCNDQGEAPSSSTSDTPTSDTSQDTSSSSETIDEKSYTINCLDWSFAGGTQFGGSDQSTNRTALINYLNNDSGLISDITDSDKIQSGAYGDHSNSRAFQLGSGQYNGMFTFNFAKTLRKISVTAESYWKSFDYPTPGTVSADTQSELKFAQNGSLIHTLNLKTDEHGRVETAEVEFDEGTDSLTLFTDSFNEEGVGAPGRVMIRSFTFYYSE